MKQNFYFQTNMHSTFTLTKRWSYNHQNISHQKRTNYDIFTSKVNTAMGACIVKMKSFEFLTGNLHSTIFVACNKLTTGLLLVYNCCVCQGKYCSILKHVLKRCDNRKSCRRPVESLSYASKLHCVNQP